jgi:hypothetical protein
MPSRRMIEMNCDKKARSMSSSGACRAFRDANLVPWQEQNNNKVRHREAEIESEESAQLRMYH